jgi:sec-independent protein translocase protein TatA
MGDLRPWHLAIIALVFVVLFGYKRLPDAARSVGRSMRIFKAETKGLRGDDDKQEAQAQQVNQSAQPPAVEAARPLAEERRVGVPDDRNSAT